MSRRAARVRGRGATEPPEPAAAGGSPGHVVVAPITARGRDLGFLRLTRDAGAQPFSDEEFSLCAEIGRRAGLALDNAQLVREARAAERSADESRELLEALLEHAPVGFAYFDRDLRFVAVNRSLGGDQRRPGRGARRPPRVRRAAGHGPGVERDLRQVLATGRALLDVESRARRRATPAARGTSRRATTACGSPAATRSASASTIVEVTRRRIAEDELRAQRDLYETLLRAQSEAGEAFVLFYGEHITYANDAAERLTGRTVDELRALGSYLDLVPTRAAPRSSRRSPSSSAAARPTRGSRPRSSAPTARSRRSRSRRARCAVAAASSSSCSAATSPSAASRSASASACWSPSAPRGARSRPRMRAPGCSPTVSAITERSLRLRNALGEVAELIVREVADVVAIDVIPRRGDQLERLAVGALEGGMRRALQRTLGEVRPLSQRDATVEVARSGRQLWAFGEDAAAPASALGARRGRRAGGSRRGRAGAADRARLGRRRARARLVERALAGRAAPSTS